MAKKLGKGLDAIFGDIDGLINDVDTSNFKSNELDIDDIRTNPYQPRKVFEDDKLKELSESIKEHGVFQPIIVRKAINGYELIAGERRLRASKLAGKDTIPAITVEFDDQQMMEISLLENIQREDLTAIEEAEAYDKLLHNLGYTQEELAKRIGKSRPYITNMLRLLKLPSEIREMILKNQIAYGHARALLSLEDESKMIELAKRVYKEGLSVRETEKLANEKTVEKPKKEDKEKDPHLENVRHIIENKLSTGVGISKNKITISYKGVDDLNRILEILDCLD